jgi:hypothetical protein
VQLVLDQITDPAIVGSATRGYEIAEELAKKRELEYLTKI